MGNNNVIINNKKYNKNLTKLYLNSNQLTILPPEIGALINLTELYIHNNFNQTDLDSLINEDNKIVMLSNKITFLKDIKFPDTLECIKFNENHIKYINNVYISDKTYIEGLSSKQCGIIRKYSENKQIENIIAVSFAIDYLSMTPFEEQYYKNLVDKNVIIDFSTMNPYN